MTRTHGDLFKISDRALLASVVNTLVRMRGGGSESEAAKAIGISRSTLNRIRRAIRPTLTRESAIALEAATKAIDADLANRFRAALISPDAMRIFRDGYLAWCNERMSRLASRDGPSWVIDPTRGLGTASGADIAILRGQIVRAIWRSAHAAFPDVFAAFRNEMMHRNVDLERQEVAVLRVLEPLLEASQSAYVERSWSELSPKERRDFIDAGIRRELILLDREPALQRATRIATEGAHTFAREAHTK